MWLLVESPVVAIRITEQVWMLHRVVQRGVEGRQLTWRTTADLDTAEFLLPSVTSSLP
jgi:hypothetical protein